MTRKGKPVPVSAEQIEELREALKPLVGTSFSVLRLPKEILQGFEPSQVGTIAGALMDACIPQLDQLQEEGSTFRDVGLVKHEGVLKDREGYPDYLHDPSGLRVELKLLYVDPAEELMKRPATPREPSARLTQKVTVKNVDPARDTLLILAYTLAESPEGSGIYCPTVVDLEVLSMCECIEARDRRLVEGGGRWFGDFETPAVVSKKGKRKLRKGKKLDTSSYGRKESEGHDFNEDTNFGKLKRIPYPPLKKFIKRYRTRNDQ